jgi:uncharacterized metal-binding protein
LRWIWLPYQKSVRHRSFWSHGFLVGTTLRLLYLGLCILAIGAVLLLLWSGAIAGGQWWQVFQDASQVLLSHSIGFLQQHSREGLFLFLGLEIGAMSHSVADRLLSAWKRSRRRRKSSRKS